MTGRFSNNRKKAVVWGCVGVLVCAWMFCLGVLVGRGTAPVGFDIDALEKQLTALKAAAKEKARHQYRIDAASVDSQADLGFHEALKTSPGEFQAATDPLMAGGAARKSGATGKSSIPVKVKPEAFKKKRNTGAARASSGLVIQVASTKDAAYADMLVDRLKAQGYAAYRTVCDIPNKGVWYRIRVGQLSSRPAAEAALARLKQQRYSPILVDTGSSKEQS